MNTPEAQQNTPLPPRWIQAIGTGFNVIANNVHLIILPIILDLFLWLGPHMRVKTLLEPYLSDLISVFAGANSDALAFSESMQDLWQNLLTQFNLFSLLRTYPVGVPSFFANASTIQTPFGTPMIIEMTSTLQAALSMAGVTMVGLFLGTLYYNLVARAATTMENSTNLWKNFLQTFALTLAMVLFLFILTIPFTLLLSIVALIGPAYAQIMLILAGVLLIWMLVPLIFSAHGIYVFHQNAMISLLTSVRMVRFLLPGVSTFIVISILLVMGLDLIWSIPGAESWMQLVGIAGHAFIASAVLASSFVYYRDGVHFMQETLRKWANQPATPA
ncbi:MAG: hypothetical protein HPY76_14040 [Anaerolineae bacterium]|nr:hypothetical protein [Anaerolineae bacterium]